MSEIPASFEPRTDEHCHCGQLATYWSSSGDGYACEEHKGSLFLLITGELRAYRGEFRQKGAEMTKSDDRDYPSGESLDSRLQRWLVDQGTDPRIRSGGTDAISFAGHEVYDLLATVAEWAYWRGVTDVRNRHGLT